MYSLESLATAQTHQADPYQCRSVGHSTSQLKQGLTIEVASVLKILPMYKCVFGCCYCRRCRCRCR